MEMDQKTVLKIAHLARIRLKPEEVERMQQSLQGIFNWVAQLDEVDTKATDPLFNVTVDQMPMREDIVNDGNKANAVLSNAPGVAFDMFVVPKVVE